MEDKEKCYITRDEGCNWVWVWRKLHGKAWEPIQLKGCEVIVFFRENRSLENTDSYLIGEFKKKFGIGVNKKEKRCVHLPVSLLDNEDYKLISDDPKRKR